MRILLTGASGFVGGHTARALRADGHELRLLTRASSDLSRLHNLPHEHVIVDLAADLAGDHSGLDAACEGIDVVGHVAARLRGRDEAAFMRTNSLATAALGQAARRAGVKSFVYLSSVAALGPAPGDEPEPPDTPIHPISFYGRSKAGGERALAELADDMAIAMIRPPMVYGPADRGLLMFFQMAMRGITLRLTGAPGGGNRVSAIYGPDLAEALTTIVAHPPERIAIWHINDGGPGYTWTELLAALERASGRRLRAIPLPGPAWVGLALAAEGWSLLTSSDPLLDRSRVAEMRQRAWLADGAQLQADTGWRPRTQLEAGMAETMNWYQLAGWL